MGICQRIGSVVCLAGVGVILANSPARADGDLAHVQHIIIAMHAVFPGVRPLARVWRSPTHGGAPDNRA